MHLKSFIKLNLFITAKCYEREKKCWYKKSAWMEMNFIGSTEWSQMHLLDLITNSPMFIGLSDLYIYLWKLELCIRVCSLSILSQGSWATFCFVVFFFFCCNSGALLQCSFSHNFKSNCCFSSAPLSFFTRKKNTYRK